MAAKFRGRARSLRYGVSLCPGIAGQDQKRYISGRAPYVTGETTTKHEQFKNLEK